MPAAGQLFSAAPLSLHLDTEPLPLVCGQREVSQGSVRGQTAGQLLPISASLRSPFWSSGRGVDHGVKHSTESCLPWSKERDWRKVCSSSKGSGWGQGEECLLVRRSAFRAGKMFTEATTGYGTTFLRLETGGSIQGGYHQTLGLYLGAETGDSNVNPRRSLSHSCEGQKGDLMVSTPANRKGVFVRSC